MTALEDEPTWARRLEEAYSLRRNLRALFLPPATHLRPLDGLRALSILWVMLFHSAWYAAPFVPFPTYVALLGSRWMTLVWRGDFGVDVFFVMSGFLIAGIMIDEHQRTGRIGRARFYWRRLLRLWPALLVAALLDVLVIGDNRTTIWANVLYVSNFVPIRQAAMGWTWSLAIEEQFYLVSPWLVAALAPLVPRARLEALVGILVVLVLVGAYVVATGPFSAIDAEIAVNRDFLRWAHGFDHLYVKPWMRAGPLVVGVACAYMFRSAGIMGRLAAAGRIGSVAIVAAVGVAAASTHWPLVVAVPRGIEVAFLAASRTLFGGAVGLLLLFALSRHTVGSAIGRFLSWRPFYPIAQVAYSAYLVNPIVCTVTHRIVSPLVWQGRAAPMALFVPLDFMGTLLLASLLYVFVERPFMALRDSGPFRDPTVVPLRIASRPWMVFGVTLLASTFAWCNRFIQDDAFISFRYARHLAAGRGLVWNVGEPPIQGFTNPLWTLGIALGIRIGIEPVALSQGGGIACFVVTLLVAAKLVHELTGARSVATAVVVGLGLNASFNAHATGGLETQSQAMFAIVVAWSVARGCSESGSRDRWFAVASTAAGLALWTRLDSAVFVVPLLLTALFEARRARSRRLALAAVLPFTLLAAGLGSFCWQIFGTLLPNTFHAKAGAVDSAVLQAGVGYLVTFLSTYLLIPLLGVAIYVGRRSLRNAPSVVRAMMFVVVAWALYLVYVGGDFIEFRLFVPILPVGAVVAAWLLHSVGGEKVVAAFAAASVVSSAVVYVKLRDTPLVEGPGIVETIRGLDDHITERDQDWVGVGRGLGRAFACDRDVTIGTMATGAIPYYSGLRTIDMLGLTDPWVARHGVLVGTRPGHRRWATLEYLVSQHVNIVLHPWRRSDPDRLATEYTRAAVVARYVPFSPVEDLPLDSAIIEIPVAPDRRVRALYLVRDARVDRCIAEGGWRVLPIGR